MAKKNINSRADGVTKDMEPEATPTRLYRFPKLNAEVEATSYQEALSKVKKSLKQ